MASAQTIRRTDPQRDGQWLLKHFSWAWVFSRDVFLSPPVHPRPQGLPQRFPSPVAFEAFLKRHGFAQTAGLNPQWPLKHFAKVQTAGLPPQWLLNPNQLQDYYSSTFVIAAAFCALYLSAIPSRPPHITRLLITRERCIGSTV